MMCQDINGIINVGYGSDILIKDLVQLIKDIIGYNGNIEWDSSKPNGTYKKLLNSSKINDLGWFPKTKLEDGIKLTYEWFLNNQHLRWLV